MEIPPQWPARFTSKFRVDEVTGCWVWTASTTRLGYGRIGRGRRGEGWTGAHRFGWELIHGPIPDGLVMDHLCRNPPCVNPEHLEPVPQGENVIRGDLGNRNGMCRAGLHPWVPENMIKERGGNGRHRCRECRNEWGRRQSVGIAQALRTHCPQGHPYDEANTFVKRDGSRSCRTCHRESQRQRYHRKKAEEAQCEVTPPT
jgi:hypothetical protein